MKFRRRRKREALRAYSEKGSIRMQKKRENISNADVEKKLRSLKLTAYDFNPCSLVRVVQQPGSILFFEPAFALKWNDWWFVYTEHDGYHFYHRDDVEVTSFMRKDKAVPFEQYKQDARSIKYLKEEKKKENQQIAKMKRCFEKNKKRERKEIEQKRNAGDAG